MDWTHAPIHRTGQPGCYFITAGTYLKQHHLAQENRRDRLIALFRRIAEEMSITVHAWVVLSNHYHLMLEAPGDVISRFASKVHSINAHEMNAEDKAPGRRVWYQYWDKFITRESSFFARLNYIHQNPVHHGIVAAAHNYRWSSLRVFEERDRVLAAAVREFKIDNLNVYDDF
jgi:putative transposase